jgi:hypothetical protein
MTSSVVFDNISSVIAQVSATRKKAEQHDDRTTGHGVPEIDAKELGKLTQKSLVVCVSVV